MAKDATPTIVTPETAFNVTVIYLSIALCLVIVGGYFMYRVYKKLQGLNDDFIKISTKNDSLDNMTQENSKYIEFIKSDMRTQKNKQVHEPPAPKELPKVHEEEIFEKTPKLEDVTGGN